MNGNARLFLKDARKVKRRHVNRTRNIVERDTFTHARGEVSLRSFSALSMFSVCALAFRRAAAAMHKRGLEHVSD